MHRRKVIAAVIVTIAVAAASVAFPMYPTRLSICELIADRGQEPDRWASPHRGAVLTLRGTLIGGPDGMYAFQTECSGRRTSFAVEKSRLTLATLSSHRTLSTLANADWQRHDRTAPVSMLVRVSSEVQSCFGPGLVVTALAVRTEGPVTTTERRTASR